MRGFVCVRRPLRLSLAPPLPCRHEKARRSEELAGLVGNQVGTPDDERASGCLRGTLFRRGLPPDRGDQFLLLMGQVQMPSIRYSGQKRNRPVSNRMMPSHPHHPTVLVAASAISTMPMMMRSARSMLPTFSFMMTPW